MAIRLQSQRTTLALVATLSVATLSCSDEPSASSGADGTTGGGGSEECPGYATIADDFEDGAVGSTWQAFLSPPTYPEERDGALVVTIGASTDGLQHGGGYTNGLIQDFAGCQVTTTVSAVPAAESAAESYLSVVDIGSLGPGTGMYVGALQGELRCVLSTDGDAVILGSTPWNPAAHRRWRLREDAGTALCETSDGDDGWVALGSTPTPAYFGAGQVVLGARNRDVASATEARFEDVNLP